MGRSSGPDNLVAEHLINAHPLLVVHITELFKCITSLSYVPRDFGKRVILIPVILKLVELVISDMSQEFLITDDLQLVLNKTLAFHMPYLL